MSAISVTYVFSNGTTSDATQVNQNFTDLVNGLSDGTKTLTVAAIVAPAMTGPITVTGTLTVSGVFSASGGKMRSGASVITGAATDLGHGIFGTTASTQIQIDDNEIQAMNNVTPASIFINRSGGTINLGAVGATTQIVGSFAVAKDAAFSNSVRYTHSTYTTNQTLDNTNFLASFDATAGNLTCTLPPVATIGNVCYVILKSDTSTNTVTVTGNAAETIDGTNTVVLGGNVGRSRLVIYNAGGTAWRIAELYEEGTWTATLTGCTTSPTVTVSFVRNGKSVSLKAAALTATSNTNACTFTGMPSFLFPVTRADVAIPDVVDNSVEHIGLMQIETTGVWTLKFWSAITTVTASFTNVNFKGLGQGLAINYTLQ